MGRVRRMRRVGRWFLEISFESFAQDLATPSARSFAQESESQNAMQPARSCRAGFIHTGGATSSLPVRRRIGQRGRCPSQCGGESRAAGTLPIPCEGESQKPSLSRKSLPNLPNFSTNESYGVSQSMLKRRMQVCDDFLSRRNIKISQEVV